MTTNKQTTRPFSIRLTDEMQAYLAGKAEIGFRSVNSEIVMRLELSRKLEPVQPQGAQ